MPTVQVSFYDPEGAYKRRRVEAADEQAALSQIEREGMSPVEAKIISSSSSGFRTKLSNDELIDFFEHLELQLGGGITTPVAFESLRTYVSKPKLKRILNYVTPEITSGEMKISEALGKFPRSFPKPIVAVIEAGEGSGLNTLVSNIKDLRERIEFEDEVKSNVRQGLAYPAFIVFLACLLVAFLMTYLVPKFTLVLKELHAPMPPLTAFVIDMGRLFQHNALPIFGLLLGVPFLLLMLRKIPALGIVIDRTVLRLPLIGPVYQSLATAMITRYYRSMYMAGQTPGYTLQLCEALFSNSAIRHEVGNIRVRVVEHSMSLADAFHASGFFPSDAVGLIRSGQTSGNLADALGRISQFHLRYAQKRIKHAMFWLPIILLFIVGGVVGSVMLSLILPLLTISNSI